MKRYPPVLAAAAAFAAVALASACRMTSEPLGARIEERTEVIRTYPFSDPDPVPIFARSSMWGQGARLYPYFFYDGFTADGSDREWSVVRLSNPHIEVAVLPQVGGKVWGAADKATGRDFLYWNRVLKFRQIALRGPWTSGGIEFNFGVVGHAPWTATPVDHVLRRDPDGGVSCIVGTMDLPSRTRWSVTITLPPDGAAFETNALWVNSTPFSQSSYAWSCAAVRTADDLRYIFPGRWHIGHDYSVPLEPWPVDRSGRDLAWYRNNATPGSKSYFTVGEYEDFYGGWYEREDAGFGHWSPYVDMPGRKIWIWDLSRSGEIWVDLLTDEDGQYTEPQAGRLLNQSDHGEFPPGAADRWREIWFPYRGIGPMAKASPHAVLSVSRDGDRLALGLFPLRPLAETLTVRADGREIVRESLTLRPEGIWKKDLSLAGAAAGADLEIRLGDKLVHRTAPETRSLDRPLDFRTVRDGTAEGLYLQAARLERERRLAEALDKYMACIDLEPLHVRALCRVAELHTRRGEPSRALEHAGRALSVSMYDPEANYVYAVAARRLGRLVDAKETLGWAARSAQFRAPALIQSAEIALLEKEFASAAAFALEALEADARNVTALEVLAVAHRLAGNRIEARRTVETLLELDPLDHLARFERYLRTRSPRDLETCRSLVRGELPHETWLEMALFYIRNGLEQDAVAALENAGEHPAALTWLAYLARDASPQSSAALLERASSLSPFLVFPFREESITAFSWAVAARPSDWKPKYYLGLILWGKGRLDETRDLFQMCDEADYAPFFIARGSLFEKIDPSQARADHAKAVSLDPESWRARHALTSFYLRSGDKAAALSAAERAAADFPEHVRLHVDLAEARLANGRPDDAAAVLDRIESLPYEGASDVHGLYVRTHVARGLAAMRKGAWTEAVEALERSKLYPEKLGTGAPFHPDTRMQDYLIALCLDRMGQRTRAAEIREGIREYTLAHWGEPLPYGYYGGRALEDLGRREDRLRARELLSRGRPAPEIMEILRRLR
jgi:tetratricopeptide (TPR) repeat protein